MKLSSPFQAYGSHQVRLSHALIVGAVLTLALALPATVRADMILADFATDLRETTPTPGWSYLWNANGPIGNSANYVSLVATPPGSVFFGNLPYYTGDGSPNLPRPFSAYTYFGIAGFGPADRAPGGHPGRGFAFDGVERYAIAAFTLSTSGLTSITNGFLESFDGSTDGIHLRVFVNNSDTLFDLDVTAHTTRSFGLDLGDLQAGDTVYVVIGSKAVDTSDAFRMGYQITQEVVPEPHTLTLLGVGTLGLIGYGWRRRKSSAAWTQSGRE